MYCFLLSIILKLSRSLLPPLLVNTLYVSYLDNEYQMVLAGPFFQVPHLLQVVKRRRIKSTLSRKNILARDSFTCQ